MNIRKVKLVHETPAHFIMHDGTAHFHIAKKGLDKELIGRIKGFAHGGEYPEGTSENVKSNFTPEEHEHNEAAKKRYREQQHHTQPKPEPTVGEKIGEGMERISNPENYSHGGRVDNNQHAAEMEAEAKLLNTPEEYPELRQVMHYAEADLSNQPVGETPTEQAPITLDTNGAQPQVVSQGPQVPQEQQVSMAPPQQAAPVAPQEQPPVEQTGGIPKVPTTLEEAEKLQMGGIQGIAKQEAAAASQMAEALKTHNEAQQQKQQLYDQHLQQVESNIDKFRTAAESGKIDANKYWNDMSTGSKISAALGLMLGGVSSGLTGQANPAATFIQAAINNDIKAQEADQSNKMNMYKMGLQEYGDVQAARTAAMLQANTLVQAKLNQISQTSQSPIIKAKDGQLMGDLFKASLPLKVDLAQRSLLLNLSGGNGADINPMALDEKTRELVYRGPGGKVSLATTPKGAEILNQTLPVFDEVEGKLRQMKKDQEEYGRGIIPYGKTQARGEALRSSILAKMSQLESLNRLTHEEIKLFEKMIPSSSDLLQGPALEKMNRALEDVAGKRRNLLQSYSSTGNKAIPQIKTRPPKL